MPYCKRTHFLLPLLVPVDPVTSVLSILPRTRTVVNHVQYSFPNSFVYVGIGPCQVPCDGISHTHRNITKGCIGGKETETSGRITSERNGGWRRNGGNHHRTGARCGVREGIK